MKPKNPTKEQIHVSAERATRDSAKLEGRSVPSGYQRSTVVKKYIDRVTRPK
ncbi:MAG: hypothetical protein M9952_13680 [Microthrixaceae bacterium]|nr:hypothetical protein [Microthrixaceae bacterium]